MQKAELDHVRNWFGSSLGDKVLEVEKAILDQLLPGFFGYHLLQLSVQQAPLYQSSPIQHKFDMGIIESDGSPFVARATELPLEGDSVDVVLLHHILDFCRDREQILREIARVSIPMGHLVVVGFNPVSLWGGWKVLAAAGKSAPWNASFIRAGRLMDWLNVLNFKIDRAQYGIYGLPVTRTFLKGGVPDYTRGISRGANWPFGAVYVIVARKQVGTMTPIRPVWRPQRAFGKLTVVRPTGRNMARNTRE